jgi:hypothetical protein
MTFNNNRIYFVLLILTGVILSCNFVNILYAQPLSPSAPFGGMNISSVEGVREISGHYSNSTYGIADIMIPDGWVGQESLYRPVQYIMYIDKPWTPGTEVIVKPLFYLSVINNSEFSKMMTPLLEAGNLSKQGEPEKSPSEIENLIYSIDPSCKVQTSSSVINGKTFDVILRQCEDSIGKSYSYDNGQKTYVLTMASVGVSHGENFVDLFNQYLPILEETAKTLKII